MRSVSLSSQREKMTRSFSCPSFPLMETLTLCVAPNQQRCELAASRGATFSTGIRKRFASRCAEHNSRGRRARKQASYAKNSPNYIQYLVMVAAINQQSPGGPVASQCMLMQGCMHISGALLIGFPSIIGLTPRETWESETSASSQYYQLKCPLNLLTSRNLQR